MQWTEQDWSILTEGPGEATVQTRHSRQTMERTTEKLHVLPSDGCNRKGKPRLLENPGISEKKVAETRGDNSPTRAISLGEAVFGGWHGRRNARRIEKNFHFCQVISDTDRCRAGRQKNNNTLNEGRRKTQGWKGRRKERQSLWGWKNIQNMRDKKKSRTTGLTCFVAR